MTNQRQSVKSVLTIVAFLVLTAIATIIYGGDEKQKAQLETNFFWRQTKTVLDTVWAAAQGLVNINLERNTGLKQEFQETWEVVNENPEVVPVVDQSFWRRLISSIKTEWNQTDQAKELSRVNPVTKSTGEEPAAAQWLRNLWPKQPELRESNNYFDFLKNLGGELKNQF